MLPNRFPDGGDQPEYNAVDASLWYVVVVGELLAHAVADTVLSRYDRAELESAVVAILNLVVVTVLGAVIAGIYNLAVKVTGGLLVGFTSN